MKNGSFLAGSSGKGIEVARTEPGFVIDADGNRHIDFLSGWCVGNVGWGNSAIQAAVRNFNGPAYVSPNQRYAPWEKLAETLAGLAPGKLDISFRATGGTEAVDIALQIAMAHTQRRKFISVEGSYHGNSIGAHSIGDDETRDHIANHLSSCAKISLPLDAAAARRLESMLKKEDVAAFIMEPIICNLGVYIPHKEFMTEVRRICSKYGTLLIFDEVATGFYRTGTLFACERFGVEPDILCLAKAITGGYAALGAAVTTREIARSVEKEDLHFYSTYGWHPLSAAVALANLEYLRQHKGRLLRNISDAGGLIDMRLSSMHFRDAVEIRRAGLAIAIDVGNEEYAAQIERQCGIEGLLVSAQGEAVTMFPALNIDQEILRHGLDILERAVDASSVRRRKHARAG